jgi:large conductance mechanosensitive channel
MDGNRLCEARLVGVRREKRGQRMLNGFKKFILRGNVVDLAIAVVIGLAFNAVIQALVRDIVTPLIAAIFGKPNFETLTFTIHHSRFLYGDLINYLIAFISVAAAIYFLVVAPMNEAARRRRAGTEEDATVSEEIELLTEIRDLLARSSGTPAAP